MTADREMSDELCDRPPVGWYCTRDAGHDGPCAAWPMPTLTIRGLGFFGWLAWRWETFRRPTFCFRCDKAVRPNHFKRCPCRYYVSSGPQERPKP